MMVREKACDGAPRRRLSSGSMRHHSSAVFDGSFAPERGVRQECTVQHNMRRITSRRWCGLWSAHAAREVAARMK